MLNGNNKNALSHLNIFRLDYLTNKSFIKVHQPAIDFTVFQSAPTLGMIIIPMLAAFISAWIGYWAGILMVFTIIFLGFIFVWCLLDRYCDFLAVYIKKVMS